ncbi:probable glucuronosyltransferase Os03g0107900 [Phoenix dactylifera]|uniref:Probable glucuronosyltransferase Os03g0107900 n=1 Tax=Phoenix dactylifera TaxID=42345 RepID=A0A8B7CZN1_PHODC|nr:probable glucuronosyltransferase Os03g0107900 [Phoenix dactylifera]
MPELRASHHHSRSYFSSYSPSPHMKLLPRRTHLHHPHHHYEKALCLKKYSKWLLWLGLSIYLFSSSSSTLFPRPTPTSLPKTTLPLKTTPRALIEARNTSTCPPFKIYVYDLPSRYNRDWLADRRCETHLFAAEVALHEAFLDSPRRALDPNDADFFFVPVYVSCNFSTPNGFPSLGHARPLLASAVELISSQLPFWNRSRGRDHLFVASHDYGACFHAMEDRAIRNGIPEFLKESVILQAFGMRTTHVCQEVEHVQIPPYVPPDIERWPASETVKRDIWVFFRGKMEVHPKNISGRFYGRRVRTEIWHRYGNNPRFYLRRKRFAGYQSEIARSVFCLCPLGWAPWSPRLVEAVALGCVPVIIADGIRLPFPEAVRWQEISLTVAERDVGNLEPILDHVAATNLSAIQRNLWDTAKRRALLFHRRIEEGDATWQVLKELEGKLDRSWRWGQDQQLRVASWS